jgi:hypothetical protein
MVAVQAIGVQLKDIVGKNEGLKLYVNAFFPVSFRGVTELKYPDIVRISGRITAIDELPDRKDKGVTTIRLSIHGYSVVKAMFDRGTNVAQELGAVAR